MYGDAGKLRARLRTLIKQGDDLLASIDAQETTHKSTTGVGLVSWGDSMLFESAVGRRIVDWHWRIGRTLTEYLGKGAPQTDLKPPVRAVGDRAVAKLVSGNRTFIRMRQDVV